jgi:hypothetical protein
LVCSAVTGSCQTSVTPASSRTSTPTAINTVDNPCSARRRRSLRLGGLVVGPAIA